jgi:D-alanine-D-alanine ligase
MVVAPTGEFVILEVNSNPGMTDLSDLPAQCAAMGLGYDALVEVLVAPLVGQLVQAG